MYPQLSPGEGLDQLLHGAEAARQGNKRVGQVRHQRFALVHRIHHPQVRQILQRYFLFQQSSRDYTRNIATSRNNGVRDGAHQSHGTAAVDQANSSLDQQFAQLCSGCRVDRTQTRAGATENTNSVH